MRGTYTFKLAKTIEVSVEAKGPKDAQAKLEEKLRDPQWFIAFALATTTHELLPAKRKQSQ